MTADDERMLDPERIATRGFSTSFRGFETDEVRRFLEQLADALRAQKNEVAGFVALSPELDLLTSERDELVNRNADLEEQLRSAESELQASTATRSELAAAQEFDEAAMTELLGKETTRVLDAARGAAADIAARAEAIASQRTNELDEREARVTSELEEKRTELDATVAKLRATAEEEAKKLTRDAAERASTLRAGADAEVESVKKAAEEEALILRTGAKEESVRLTSQAETEAATLRSEAEEAAVSLRATAEADASSAQDAAREQARQMLNEAQAIREKVLADLVKRRRVGRQQLDQVKAARDRLARSLAVVRKDLDEAMGELVAAVPDARAAMEAVGRRIPESSDNRQAADLAVELDTARVAGILLPGMPDDEDDDGPLPDIDELFDRIKTGDDDSDADGGRGVTKDGKRRGDQPSTAGKQQPSTAGKQQPKPEKSKSGRSKPQTPTGRPKAKADRRESRAGKKTVGAKTATVDREAEGASATERVDEAEPPEMAEAVDEAEATLGADTPRADDDPSTDVPAPFIARDVAMTRFGPDLRRQLKRVLADDQSQILDALRRADTEISVSDLPDADSERSAYVDVLAGALKGAAASGASVIGGELADEVIDELVERFTSDLLDPLRQKIERVVEDSDDRAEALEPIRAHFRQLRSDHLPEMVDDGLAEAFALGLFHAIAEGSAVRWLGDPRVEAGPDCHDNTLAGSVTKAEAFPTGHVVPPGSPGCRCLVVANQ